MSKHEKKVAVLIVISVLLIVISLCPGGCEEATSILQGIGTGLVSGIVLLLVTSTKSREYKQLTEIYNIVHECNLVFENISQLYGDVYHKTYHGKKEKMSFNTYFILIKETYNKYKDVFETIQNIDYNLIQYNNIGMRIEEFITYMYKEINKIEEDMAKNKIHNKDDLTKIREKFYLICNKAYHINAKSFEYEQLIDKQRKHIDSSLF